ncbi:hypothetical protein EB796_014759 [Bugula neritina]|uniref:Reverse transcriptase domain-containing protein n=1 Tax=Bugula neritina TaxID=10212 RepID=A0A7J7JKQ8_BUGNE|nr:hypothetical protein EB796_014759 [Bugula neritina]
MDDVCIWGKSQEEHDSRVRAVLRRMVDAGMTLNVEKCKFSRSSIKFLGHVISSSGIRANPEAVQGIESFATPTCVKDVRSFLGMANQLSKFSTRLGELSAPLRELLHKNTPWIWDVAQEQAFCEIKKELQRCVELAPYSPQRETVIHTDASQCGIDALSRSVGPISEADVMFMEEVELFAVSALHNTATSPRLKS